MFLGLQLVIYPTTNLEADKLRRSSVLGVQPYFDEPFYVGFSVKGFELGLDPNANSEGKDQSTAYWGVENMENAIKEFVSKGGVVQGEPQDVGGGIKMAVIQIPTGEKVGIIENPRFTLDN